MGETTAVQTVTVQRNLGDMLATDKTSSSNKDGLVFDLMAMAAQAPQSPSPTTDGTPVAPVSRPLTAAAAPASDLAASPAPRSGLLPDLSETPLVDDAPISLEALLGMEKTARQGLEAKPFTQKPAAEWIISVLTAAGLAKQKNAGLAETPTGLADPINSETSDAVALVLTFIAPQSNNAATPASLTEPTSPLTEGSGLPVKGIELQAPDALQTDAQVEFPTAPIIVQTTAVPNAADADIKAFEKQPSGLNNGQDTGQAHADVVTPLETAKLNRPIPETHPTIPASPLMNGTMAPTALTAPPSPLSGSDKASGLQQLDDAAKPAVAEVPLSDARPSIHSPQAERSIPQLAQHDVKEETGQPEVAQAIAAADGTHLDISTPQPISPLEVPGSRNMREPATPEALIDPVIPEANGLNPSKASLAKKSDVDPTKAKEADDNKTSPDLATPFLQPILTAALVSPQAAAKPEAHEPAETNDDVRFPAQGRSGRPVFSDQAVAADKILPTALMSPQVAARPEAHEPAQTNDDVGFPAQGSSGHRALRDQAVAADYSEHVKSSAKPPIGPKAGSATIQENGKSTVAPFETLNPEPIKAQEMKEDPLDPALTALSAQALPTERASGSEGRKLLQTDAQTQPLNDHANGEPVQPRSSSSLDERFGTGSHSQSSSMNQQASEQNFNQSKDSAPSTKDMPENVVIESLTIGSHQTDGDNAAPAMASNATIPDTPIQLSVFSEGDHSCALGGDSFPHQPASPQNSGVSTANAAPSSATMVRVDNPIFIAQRDKAMQQQIISALRAGHDEIRLSLYPPQLGQVTINMALDGQKVKVGVKTTNREATNLLIGERQSLASALGHEGFMLEGYDVADDAPQGRSSEKSLTEDRIISSKPAAESSFSIDITI